MSTSPIVPALEQLLAPSPVREADTLDDQGLLVQLESGTADRSPWQSHRRLAAGLIRRLGGRTEAVLRRELDRFFAARPELSHADRAAIARAMSRFRNQLLHHPRRTLRAAAATDHTAGVDPLLDVVRGLFALSDAPHSDRSDARTPASRPTRTSANSAS